MTEFTKFYIRFLEQLWNNIIHFFVTIGDLIARMFYKDWAVNGYIQLFTENAVKEFQRRNGLGVDGIVGKNTFNALFR